jgi:hypothetical protein
MCNGCTAAPPGIRYRLMRKCETCGYLLFGEGETCKHCGGTLPLVSVAALVTSGAAASVAAPPMTAPPMAPPPVAPPPLASPAMGPLPVATLAPPLPPSVGRAPVAREYWTPSAPPEPAKPSRSTPRVLIALISVASMALGWVAVGQLLHKDSIPAGTSAFVAGHGVVYSSPDHTFDARFPSTPTVDQKVIAVSSASATLNLAQVQTDDYEVVAASLVLPVAVPPGQVDSVLHEILRAGAASQGDTIVSESHVTKYGVPGLEVRAKVSDGYDARLMVLISGPRVYLLGVHAKTGTGRLYDALVASLIMY